MKLNHLIHCIDEWKKVWDPEQPGLTKHSRGYYNAFHTFLERGLKEMKKQIDDIRYLSVS